MLRKEWTKQEAKELMEFIDKQNLLESLNIFAQEKGRSFSSVHSKYYTTSKKNETGDIKVENKGARHNQIWTGEEKRNLSTLIAEGKSHTEIADILNRTVYAVGAKAIEQRLVSQPLTTNITMTPIADYMKKNNLVVKSEVPKEKIKKQPKTLLVKGTEIRFPISMRIESDELVLTIQ